MRAEITRLIYEEAKAEAKNKAEHKATKISALVKMLSVAQQIPCCDTKEIIANNLICSAVQAGLKIYLFRALLQKITDFELEHQPFGEEGEQGTALHKVIELKNTRPEHLLALLERKPDLLDKPFVGGQYAGCSALEILCIKDGDFLLRQTLIQRGAKLSAMIVQKQISYFSGQQFDDVKCAVGQVREQVSLLTSLKQSINVSNDFNTSRFPYPNWQSFMEFFMGEFFQRDTIHESDFFIINAFLAEKYFQLSQKISDTFIGFIQRNIETHKHWVNPFVFFVFVNLIKHGMKINLKNLDGDLYIPMLDPKSLFSQFLENLTHFFNRTANYFPKRNFDELLTLSVQINAMEKPAWVQAEDMFLNAEALLETMMQFESFYAYDLDFYLQRHLLQKELATGLTGDMGRDCLLMFLTNVTVSVGRGLLSDFLVVKEIIDDIIFGEGPEPYHEKYKIEPQFYIVPILAFLENQTSRGSLPDPKMVDFLQPIPLFKDEEDFNFLLANTVKGRKDGVKDMEEKDEKESKKGLEAKSLDEDEENEIKGRGKSPRLQEKELRDGEESRITWRCWKASNLNLLGYKKGRALLAMVAGAMGLSVDWGFSGPLLPLLRLPTEKLAWPAILLQVCESHSKIAAELTALQKAKSLAPLAEAAPAALAAAVSSTSSSVSLSSSSSSLASSLPSLQVQPAMFGGASLPAPSVATSLSSSLSSSS